MGATRAELSELSIYSTVSSGWVDQSLRANEQEGEDRVSISQITGSANLLFNGSVPRVGPSGKIGDRSYCSRNSCLVLGRRRCNGVELL